MAPIWHPLAGRSVADGSPYGVEHCRAPLTVSSLYVLITRWSPLQVYFIVHMLLPQVPVPEVQVVPRTKGAALTDSQLLLAFVQFVSEASDRKETLSRGGKKKREEGRERGESERESWNDESGRAGESRQDLRS